jgi:hypothetical protein
MIKKISILAIMTLTGLALTASSVSTASNVKEEEVRIAAEKRMDFLIGESASVDRLRSQAQAQYELAVAKAKAEAEAKAKAEAEAQAKAKAAAEAAAKRQVAAQRASRVASPPRQPAPVAQGSNREIGQRLAAARGWTGDQWVCLEALWTRESGWRTDAANSSGAYGIPQALPGSKMGSVGSDWRTNASTQITWGLNYIGGRYGSPCAAWSHFKSRNWY